MITKEKRAEWERMGLCTVCGGINLDPAYRHCARCRDKQREKRAKYAFNAYVEEKKTVRPAISPDHKCWNCVWSSFAGDRFFCPFGVGMCAKEKKYASD